MSADDGWSSVAADWSALWGSLADPARDAVIAATSIGPATRVLDVGCGSGEFLARVERAGGHASGIDPAPGMLELARAAAPAAAVRQGRAERLPWPDASFDVVTAFNALQFADDTVEALGELMRVTVPGGYVAVANWAERERNDIDAIEAAVAEADGEEPTPDGDLRPAGGLESLFEEAGLPLVNAALVDVVWAVADDDALVRGALLGEDEEVQASLAPVVLAAARPFRVGEGEGEGVGVGEGGYRLRNAFRVAIGRLPPR